MPLAFLLGVRANLRAHPRAFVLENKDATRTGNEIETADDDRVRRWA